MIDTNAIMTALWSEIGAGAVAVLLAVAVVLVALARRRRGTTGAATVGGANDRPARTLHSAAH